MKDDKRFKRLLRVSISFLSLSCLSFVCLCSKFICVYVLWRVMKISKYFSALKKVQREGKRKRERENKAVSESSTVNNLEKSSQLCAFFLLLFLPSHHFWLIFTSVMRRMLEAIRSIHVK